MNNNKPLSLVYRDFKQNIISIINNAQIPPYLASEVLQNILHEINAQSERMIAEEEQRWQDEQRKEDEAEVLTGDVE
jgi:hypothetical protein